MQHEGTGVKLALRTGAPIVPVAIVGAEETVPLLGNLPAGFLGLDYLPVTLPPLPARWMLCFGEPISMGDLPPDSCPPGLCHPHARAPGGGSTSSGTEGSRLRGCVSWNPPEPTTKTDDSIGLYTRGDGIVSRSTARGACLIILSSRGHQCAQLGVTASPLEQCHVPYTSIQLWSPRLRFIVGHEDDRGILKKAIVTAPVRDQRKRERLGGGLHDSWCARPVLGDVLQLYVQVFFQIEHHIHSRKSGDDFWRLSGHHYAHDNK